MLNLTPSEQHAAARCQPLRPVVCNHGYWLADCALCLKRPGECDYGSCTEPAARPVGPEHRPMCERHAKNAPATSQRCKSQMSGLPAARFHRYGW